MLALTWQYHNTGDYRLAYDLLDEESKSRVPYETYARWGEATAHKAPVSDYAFPEVSINGNAATVERGITVYLPDEGSPSYRDVQPMARAYEDAPWRVHSTEEQISTYNQY